MRQTIAFLISFVFIGTTAFKPTFGDAQPQISGNWLVDIRTVCVVCGIVLGGTWWIARWMQKVEGRLSAGEARFVILELSGNTRDGKITDILAKVNQREEMLQDIQRKVHHIASGNIKHSKGEEI